MNKASITQMDTLVTTVFAQKFTTLLRELAMDILGSTDVMVFNFSGKPSKIGQSLICTYDSAPLYSNVPSRELPTAMKELQERASFAVSLSKLLSNHGISHTLEFPNGSGEGLHSVCHPRVSFRMNAENVGSIDAINQTLAQKRQAAALTDTQQSAPMPVKAEELPLIYIKRGPAGRCGPD